MRTPIHVDCDGPTERGVCLWHHIGPYTAHCQVDADPWPCDVVVLRKTLTAAVEHIHMVHEGDSYATCEQETCRQFRVPLLERRTTGRGASSPEVEP